MASLQNSNDSRPEGRRLDTESSVLGLEARVRIELTIEVLQTSALPLGYRAFDKTLAIPRGARDFACGLPLRSKTLAIPRGARDFACGLPLRSRPQDGSTWLPRPIARKQKALAGRGAQKTGAGDGI